MKQEEIEKTLNKFWDLAIASMLKESPENKYLPTTSGEVEIALEKLYNRHRENQIDMFKELRKVGVKRK